MKDLKKGKLANFSNIMDGKWHAKLVKRKDVQILSFIWGLKKLGRRGKCGRSKVSCSNHHPDSGLTPYGIWHMRGGGGCCWD